MVKSPSLEELIKNSSNPYIEKLKNNVKRVLISKDQKEKTNRNSDL